MAQLTTIVRYLDSLLRTSEYKDLALNGLQVESAGTDIKVVALAVDAGESIIAKAIAAEADLLIVHHGLLWGEPLPIRGPLGTKVRQLMSNRCSLYSSHIPLDAHLEVGNNAELARFYNLEQIESAFDYRGQKIGVIAKSSGRQLSYFIEKSKEMIGSKDSLVLPFGRDKIEKVGFVSGSGCSALEQAAASGVDLFISGEPKQEAYHIAKELKLNLLFAGHYATETFGVRALGTRLEKDFDLRSVFIDEPTGI